MAASTFGKAFDNLPEETQRGIINSLRHRRFIYEKALRREYLKTLQVILIADKPGPGRPTDPTYHHTPFYSTKNSSLWLNRQLVEAGIDEHDLLWFNAEFADGTPLDPALIEYAAVDPLVVVLGGNAEMWVRRNAPTSRYAKVYHPQFAKRFKANEPYALIDILKEKLCVSAAPNVTST